MKFKVFLVCVCVQCAMCSHVYGAHSIAVTNKIRNVPSKHTQTDDPHSHACTILYTVLLVTIVLLYTFSLQRWPFDYVIKIAFWFWLHRYRIDLYKITKMRKQYGVYMYAWGMYARYAIDVPITTMFSAKKK